jgi:AP-1 complex subunit gamma-1
MQSSKKEPTRLRDLIKAVRACKTAAEERVVIANESAEIRESFRDETCKTRHRSVAKLLFIQMMGYPTQFGQVECLKLIASNNYTEKRVGYLGLVQLLNEQDDVLLMVTNIMQIDMNSSNNQIAGMSITSMATVATAEMCRDLCKDVCKLMTHSNSYIRKKAALAGVRIARKCPDLVEDLSGEIPKLIEDRSHVVVMNGVNLLLEAMKSSPNVRSKFLQFNSLIVKAMRNLIHSVHSPEHSIGGVTDPFLQVRLIKLLCKLTTAQPAEETCDCLAQVSTNTDSAKNAGNAVLYECVKTILDVQSTSGLRVLATNIMGRFLMSRDNNLRYVALNSLLRLVKIDPLAVQRHKTTIMDCLKDPDLVIKKRALELTSVLINENNVKQIVKELIDYLLSSEAELKEAIVAKLCSALEAHSPSKQWTIDTLTQILSIAGSYVADEVISSTAHIISSTPELQAYSVHKLFRAIKDNTDQQGLVLLSVWSLGEYGDLITRTKVTFPEVTFGPVPALEIFTVLEKILISPTSDLCKEYVLTCIIKLTVRAPEHRENFKKLLSSQSASLNVELQQRACEYLSLLEDTWEPIRAPLLEKMPVFGKYASSPSAPEAIKTEKSEEVWMLDLLGDSAAPLMPGVSTGAPSLQPSTGSSHPLGLVSDLLGGLDLSSPYPANPVNPPFPTSTVPSFPGAALIPANPQVGLPGYNQGGSLIDFSGLGEHPALQSSGHENDFHEFQSAAPGPLFVIAFEDEEIQIKFLVTAGETNADYLINCVSSNKTRSEINDFKLFSAVQKHLVLNLAQASGTKMAPGEQISQQIKIHNTLHNVKPVVIRLKIDYSLGGSPRSKIATVDSIPNP